MSHYDTHNILIDSQHTGFALVGPANRSLSSLLMILPNPWTTESRQIPSSSTSRRLSTEYLTRDDSLSYITTECVALFWSGSTTSLPKDPNELWLMAKPRSGQMFFLECLKAQSWDHCYSSRLLMTYQIPSRHLYVCLPTIVSCTGLLTPWRTAKRFRKILIRYILGQLHGRWNLIQISVM